MREFKRIILHCTATPPDMHVDAEKIREWHTSPPRNWSDIGYHYVIHRDGTLEQGRPIMKQGAHVKGHNADSVGVAYAGGVDDTNKPEDNMTVKQEMTFLLLVRSLRTVFGDMTLHGHNEFAAKACPSFNVREKYRFLINDKHDILD